MHTCSIMIYIGKQLLDRPSSLKLLHTLGKSEVKVVQSRQTLCNPMDCSLPGSSVLYYLWEFAQTHVH